ncbi:Fic family protein [Paenibacillus amylolyticus]|uniref:Fic/DOC family protein n=1 Tax=Paenibacillus amylolyticus TaxID=1451 RepID=UPI00286A5E1B|nr:Fic family protein [Paenibacillus amylolyticus]
MHRYLFKEVYPFAGKVRNENIAKDNFSFARLEFVEEAAKDLFRSLKNEKQLKGLQFHEFSERAAHYKAEINVLHPFRERNGRTHREFIRCLAQSNGYELDWS